MTTLYRFFDSDGTLLYVGITDRPLARLDHHGEHQEWWSHVVRATFEHLPSRQQAQEVEWAAIKDEHPIFNAMGNDAPGRSSRWEAWEARNMRRAIAAKRAISGEYPDYRVPPYDVPCAACEALDFEPCRNRKGVVKDVPHVGRAAP